MPTKKLSDAITAIKEAFGAAKCHLEPGQGETSFYVVGEAGSNLMMFGVKDNGLRR